VPNKQKKHTVSGLVFLLIFGYSVGVIAGDANEVRRISVLDVKQMLGDPDTVIIDVRRYRNWWRSSKKIATAVREDPSKVNLWIKKYSTDKTLIFYCS
jgi:rhodanese-related sulfurtransferase